MKKAGECFSGPGTIPVGLWFVLLRCVLHVVEHTVEALRVKGIDRDAEHELRDQGLSVQVLVGGVCHLEFLCLLVEVGGV